MKLTGFQTQIVELPRDSGPMGATAMFVTLKLQTDDGIEGIAYAGFTSAIMMKALKETLDALAGQALGSDPMMIEAIGVRKLLALGGGGSPSGLVTRAVSAIDVALWDIRGKALGQPVYRLLGGFADRVPAYASGHLWRYLRPRYARQDRPRTRRKRLPGHEVQDLAARTPTPKR